MPRKKTTAAASVAPAPAPPAAAPPPKMTAAEMAELAQLRELYDLGKPAKAVMIPVPHHRLLRLVELERKDAGAGA